MICKRSAARYIHLVVVSAAMMISGCGLRVPNVQEAGEWIEGQLLVQGIITNIKCELREALGRARAEPAGAFLETWGVQTTLTLTHDESGSIAPGVIWSPPASTVDLFTLGGGLNFSANASRKNIVNAYYLVSDLNKVPCSAEARRGGPLLLQNDLKLTEWLSAVLSASATKTIDFDQAGLGVGTNVIQHQVTFEITNGGSLTPSWKLTRVTANPGGSFLTASRTRTHDLLITISPAVKSVIEAADKRGRRVQSVSAQPIRQGAEVHFSTLLAGSIEAGVRSAFQR